MIQQPYIVNEDTDFIVVYKPEGWVSQGGAVDASNNLLTWLRDKDPQGLYKVVHRLDKDTSGLIVFAKSAQVASDMGWLFSNQKVKKTYWGLSTTKPKKKQGWVKGCLSKARSKAWKLNPGTPDQDLWSSTHFVSHSLRPGIRFYCLYPKTGRTHQLRVVMKSLGVPLFGDPIYGKTEPGGDFDRMYLHCYSMSWIYNDTYYEFKAPPISGNLWLGDITLIESMVGNVES